MKTTLLVLGVAVLAGAAPAWADPTHPDLAGRFGAARSAVAPAGVPFRAASLQERETLTALLRDPDASVRLAALRALKAYVGQTLATRDAVLAVYSNAAEQPAVRSEAAKTLSLVSGYGEVYERLLAVAERGGDLPLRLISAKALYRQAAARSDVRDRLERLLLQAPDAALRGAAAWGLYAAAGDAGTRDALRRAAARDPEPGVRVEALKSLYGAMGHSDVSYDVVRLALDGSAPRELRKPAILMLSAGGNYQARQALERLVERERDPELRAAAISALNPADPALARYFHLGRTTQNGSYLDPLEDE